MSAKITKCSNSNKKEVIEEEEKRAIFKHGNFVKILPSHCAVPISPMDQLTRNMRSGLEGRPLHSEAPHFINNLRNRKKVLVSVSVNHTES